MAANLCSSETGRVHNVVRSRLSNENTVYVVNCVLRILHSHNFKQRFPMKIMCIQMEISSQKFYRLLKLYMYFHCLLLNFMNNCKFGLLHVSKILSLETFNLCKWYLTLTLRQLHTFENLGY